jgi:hypothetical protein
MAQVQIKSHGTVTSERVRSMKLATEARHQYADTAVKAGYKIVGSAPDMTILMCAEHITSGLPAGDDFCAIIACNTGR